MISKIIKQLVCPITDLAELEIIIFDDNNNNLNGILLNNSISHWYRIEDNLIELLPQNLTYTTNKKRFYQKYQTIFDSLGLKYAEIDENNTLQQVEQRNLYDHFANNTKFTYDDFEKMPFWRAVDKKVFTHWRKKIKPGDTVLDIGCGNGRSLAALKPNNFFVVGIDISEKMIRNAINRAKKEGWNQQALFLLADGYNPPFNAESFDAVITSGVLTNLPNPKQTCQKIQSLLKNNGFHFGLENNDSIFRGIFDRLMKVFKLWKNETGQIPLISRKKLNEWLSDNQTEIKSYTTVYLPPHLYNIFGVRGAEFLLNFTDVLPGYLPIFVSNGGLIVFEIIKKN